LSSVGDFHYIRNLYMGVWVVHGPLGRGGRFSALGGTHRVRLGPARPSMARMAVAHTACEHDISLFYEMPRMGYFATTVRLQTRTCKCNQRFPRSNPMPGVRQNSLDGP